MIPYYVMVGIPAFLAVFFTACGYSGEKRDRCVIDSFFLIWLILLVVRSEMVGVDIPVYKYHFINYSSMPWKRMIMGIFAGEFETGYAIICKVLSLFTKNFRWVMVVCACISVIPVWKLYRDEGRFGFLTVVTFINVAPFVMYFSGLRQAMAMAFVVPCYNLCKLKKLKKFLITVFAASLFHRSALILTLMYPVYHLRLRKKKYILYFLPLELLIYIYNIPIFSFLMKFVEGKYRDRYVAAIGATGAYAVTLLLTVILIYTFFIPNKEKLDCEVVGLRNIMLMSVVIQVFSAANTVAMRMNYYFLIFVPLLISKIINCGDKTYRSLIKISIICMVVFFTVYFFYGAYTDEDVLQVYPYYFFIRDSVVGGIW